MNSPQDAVLKDSVKQECLAESESLPTSRFLPHRSVPEHPTESEVEVKSSTGRLVQHVRFQYALSQYVLVAIFARIATGASAVAIVLLARFYGADGTMAGAFAACLTGPHILGPIFGRWLDKAHSPMTLIALACGLFSGLFQLVILSLENQWLWLTFTTLIVCGACSSFMMGGLSTQLNRLTDNDLTKSDQAKSLHCKRRQAQSWDNATYGIGLTIGPLLIGLFSQTYSIPSTIGVLMCLPLLSGAMLLFLAKTYSKSHIKKQAAPNIKQVVKVIRQSVPLKLTMLMTTSASFSLAALPVLAIYLSEVWQQSREDGAYLVTFYGIGCLFGSGFLILRPFKAEALSLLRNIGVALLISLLLLTLSYSLTFSWGLFCYWLCGVVNSLFFAATIAARTEYAPAQGAGQIYMWVAAVKISAASMGAFIAGVMVDVGVLMPMVLSCIILAMGLLFCFFKAQKR